MKDTKVRIIVYPLLYTNQHHHSHLKLLNHPSNCSHMNTKFNFSGVKLNWFPGHMATSLKQIRSRIQNEIDLIIEVRDARIPLSSANCDMIIGETKKEKVVVFTKSDLAEVEGNEKIKEMFKDGAGMLFCKDERKDLKKLLELTKNRFKDPVNPFVKNRVMVVGIPNVGKSTIINGLRASGLGLGGKAVKVGNLAGVTRSLSELVCISRHPSLIYLIDTPGILPPNIKNVEEGLKVALCGGLYDKTVGFQLLADYLLYNLNLKGNQQFKDFYRISTESETESLKTFLPIAAKRIGALVPGGEFDLERASAHFVRQFRLGKFGRITLDEL